MPATVIVGLQWGDEGKAKVLDALAEDADIVCRYQGGSNAGHTVAFGDTHRAFHLVPAGIVREGKVCVISNGVVVEPRLLIREIEEIDPRGLDRFRGRFWLSDRAHLVMPYHRLREILAENRRGAAKMIGTTRRGIGPCYVDKTGRTGFRVADLYAPQDFRAALESKIEEISRTLAAEYGGPQIAAGLAEVEKAIGFSCGQNELDAGLIAREYLTCAERLRPFVTDTIRLLNRALDEKQAILFEGAQGTMLDIDFGTYPYVTASNSTACGISSGAGVGPTRIDRVLGVLKAYTTRVGSGPFPTELTDEAGERLRAVGREFGATTGRPRRCGWLDVVQARYAIEINAVKEVAITKIDVLSGLETIKIATHYRGPDGETIDRFPPRLAALSLSSPVYEELPGWKEDLLGVRRLADLPAAARAYLDRLRELLGVRIVLVSVGHKREATIYCDG